MPYYKVNAKSMHFLNKSFLCFSVIVHFHDFSFSFNGCLSDAIRIEIEFKPRYLLTEYIADVSISTDAVYRQTFFKEELWRSKGAIGVDTIGK